MRQAVGRAGRAKVRIRRSEGSDLEKGRRVAAVIAGAWRSPPPALSIPATELEAIAPALLASGVAGLAWRRLGTSCDPSTGAARRLQEAYGFYALLARLLEDQVADTILTLRAAGVDPILIKGWTVAREYPDAALRPYRDIDLCVRPSEHARAVAALRARGPWYPVEVKSSIPDLPDRTLEEVFERTRLLRLRDVEVRALSREDHFRCLCLHALRHGVSRPPWLADIALLLEGADAGFDWSVCLAGEPRRTHWVATAIQLAVELLDCRPLSLPESAATKLPPWVRASVLREWGDPRPIPSSDRSVLEALQYRWPTPVHATVYLSSWFDRSPRLPLQIAAYLGILARGRVSRLTQIGRAWQTRRQLSS
jgi:hypothetical protein